MNSLKLFPFMPKGILSTDEEVNSATASGMYHVTGDNGISVVLNYSIMIVFNDGQGYVIQMAFRLGADVAGFRRCLNGEWGDFRTFVLETWITFAPHMALCISGSGGTGLYRTTRFLYPRIPQKYKIIQPLL